MSSVYSIAIVSLCLAYDLGFAIFHMKFWKILDWPGSLAKAGSYNSSVTQTLNIMLTFTFLIYASALAVGLAAAPAMIPWLAFVGFLFWALRAVLQPALFKASTLSRYLTVIFAGGALLHLGASLMPLLAWPSQVA